MNGDNISAKIDKWNWNPNNKKFRDSLIESSSICINHNSFIGIPCKNIIQISQSILSFSKCSSAKYMSYANLFINKNLKNFHVKIQVLRNMFKNLFSSNYYSDFYCN